MTTTFKVGNLVEIDFGIPLPHYCYSHEHVRARMAVRFGPPPWKIVSISDADTKDTHLQFSEGLLGWHFKHFKLVKKLRANKKNQQYLAQGDQQ